VVPVDAELLALPREPAGPVDKAIAAHVAGLVPDGATLQTGIGKLPDAVLAALARRSDLGIHTELLSDGVRLLAELGAITGGRRPSCPASW
jgi:4-hydroxybutyrate CoA-transferase